MNVKQYREPTKHCRFCGVLLNAAPGGNWHGSQVKHFNYICRDCHSARSANYYHRNLEACRERNRTYRLANPNAARDYRRARPEKGMLESARRRARDKGLPFDITLADVIIPERCPVLDIPLRQSVGKVAENSPSLDRIIPELGYVRGNVEVISYRANSMKRDGTPEELERVAHWLRARTDWPKAA